MTIFFLLVILVAELYFMARRREMDQSVIQAMEGRINALEHLLSHHRRLENTRGEEMRVKVEMRVAEAMARITGREKVKKIA